jgi:hypothetical protein
VKGIKGLAVGVGVVVIGLFVYGFIKGGKG